MNLTSVRARRMKNRAMVVEVLAGSDHPHQIGRLDKMVSSIGQLDTVDEEKEGMLGGDAVCLLGL